MLEPGSDLRAPWLRGLTSFPVASRSPAEALIVEARAALGRGQLRRAIALIERLVAEEPVQAPERRRALS